MRRSKVMVPWVAGLHLRPAARLVRLARGFRSSIVLKYGSRMADLRSILSVISLCAVMGTTLDVEATGVDEQEAIQG